MSIAAHVPTLPAMGCRWHAATMRQKGMNAYDRVKEWRSRPESKAMVAAQARRYRSKQPDKVKAVKEAYRERSKEDRLPREAEQARYRRRVDPEGDLRRRKAFEARREAERVRIAGRPRAEACEICGDQGKTVFDHCHTHGHFRGWICDRCNKVLGLVKDSLELLEKLKGYLSDGETQSSNAECSSR